MKRLGDSVWITLIIMGRKYYKATIKGRDKDGNLIIRTKAKNITNDELASVLYAVLEDTINQTGKNFHEIVDILSDYFEP